MSDADDPAGDLLSHPPPDLADAEVAELAQANFGLTGHLRRLTSERDLNLRLTGPDGVSHVLKVANAAEPPGQTDFQVRALRHVAAVAPELPVPRMVAAVDGRDVVPLPRGGSLRVVTWAEGMALHMAPRSDAQRHAVGAAAGGLACALAGFHHPAADHVLLWDIQRAALLRPMLGGLTEAGERAMASRFLDRFETEVAPRLADLPAQVAHADLNPHNLLVDPSRPDRVAGILDFGDMVRTPRICDLAVAASYQIDPARPVASLCAFLRGYHRAFALTGAEVALLFDLITARMVTTLVIPSWRAARQPDNAAYILRNVPSARAGLAAFATLDPAAATAAFAAILTEPADQGPAP